MSVTLQVEVGVVVEGSRSIRTYSPSSVDFDAGIMVVGSDCVVQNGIV